MGSYQDNQSGPSPSRIAFFATVVGIFIFNVFASQVLAGGIARDVGIAASHANLISTVTALGYAVGLLFVVPLADVVENRRLVLAMGAVCATALVTATVATEPGPFLAACFLSGAASSLIQILVPLVGAMTPAAVRGRVLGNVMSGLMLGIMFSRPLASLVGERFGWRGVYLMAAILVVGALVPLRAVLPVRSPAASPGYLRILGSLGTLLKTEGTLRVNAITAALAMAAFNVFWTAIASKLTAGPFHLSASGLALFGLVGTAGAVSAPIMGRLGDRGLTKPGAIVADLSILAAFALAVASGGFLGSVSPVLGIAGFVAAAILLDFGAVGDQTLGRRSINMLSAAAIGRRNGLFVGIFFLGGALGSAVVGPAQSIAGWSGVCAAGGAFGLAALLVSSFASRAVVAPEATGGGLIAPVTTTPGPSADARAPLAARAR